MRSRASRVRCAASTLLLSLSVASGCAQKTEECNALADIINANSTAMDDVFARSGADRAAVEANYTAIADLADQVSTTLSGKTLQTPELATHALDYAAAAADIAQTYREASAVVHRAATRETELDSAGAAFDATRKAVADACPVATPDCDRLHDVLAAQPADTEADEVLAVLTGYREALDGLVIQERALAEKITAHVEAVSAYAEAVARANEVQAEIESRAWVIDDIADRGDEIIARLNQTCAAQRR